MERRSKNDNHISLLLMWSNWGAVTSFLSLAQHLQDVEIKHDVCIEAISNSWEMKR